MRIVNNDFDFVFDYSHQNFTNKTLDLIKKLSEEANLDKKIKEMFEGEKINKSEQRSVLHVALRAK